MDRKEFIAQAGFAAATILMAQCFGSCSKTTSTSVDFTVDVSTGSLASNGGYLVKNGVIIARTATGSFIAVSSACTHEGTTIQYRTDQFVCPNHGAQFNESGSVTRGPASSSLTKYNTALSGTTLRVYS